MATRLKQSFASISLPSAVGVLLVFLSASLNAQQLIEAARYQDVEAVNRLLAEGGSPNEQQADGATALHWAVYREDAAMVGALLEAGADINAANRLGATALWIATNSGHSDLIEQLLAAGADPDIPLTMNETPLMTAARSGAAKGVELLIASGADVNTRENSRNQTALMWASAQGHTEVAQLLVNAGADLEARSKARPMLMFVDGVNGGAFDQGVMEQLGGFSPLLFAAREGHLEIARLLLDAGAMVDGAAANGVTPLILATHSGHGEVAALLLEAGADANAIEAGYTALHAAILRGDLATVNALLAHGASPDTRLVKPTPVQRASEDWALKTPLVGATPFWLAASFREAEIMQSLLAGGADPTLTNLERWSTPRNREDRESYTPTAVGGFETAVQAAIKGDSTRGRFYVQANPDPAGEEQLALAAVQVAADQGVNLNHRDFSESTALHDAAARRLPNIVKELAARGADINALNGSGQTPLDLALRAESRPNFFGFDTAIPGPSTSDVLRALGAIRSGQ